MVNTFLVCSDFQLSSKCLDNLRLNKQISEALYIYRVIRNLKLLAKYYDMPPPIDSYLLYDWIRLILKKYKSEKCIFLFKNCNGDPIRTSKDVKMIQQSYGQDVIINNNKYQLIDTNQDSSKKSKKPIYVDIDKLVTINDAYIKLGYVYHPIIPMWFHYVPALLYYIKVHVDEFNFRGYSNRVNIPLEGIVSYPPWCYEADFLIRHRSNLIRKNPQWYMPIFPGVINDMPYFWPYVPTVGNGIDDSNKRYQQDI